MNIRKDMKKIKKDVKGITLIALVVTIIVLLILAGVAINLTIGQNGIFQRAQGAANTWKNAEANEQLYLQEGADLINSYLNGNSSGSGENEEPISKTESYVGYYADIEGDGTVDGVIYADLAVGGSGEWQPGEGGDLTGMDWGNYEIPTETNLKEYYVKEENYDGVFGTGKVITPIKGWTPEEKNDRFYVMALKDINSGTPYCWYAAAVGRLNNMYSANDFGVGKGFTELAMMKWNDSSLPWGDRNSGTDLDMWGVIGNEINADWFVPSKSEWAAFGAALSIDTNNYEYYKLSSEYWSSTQFESGNACIANFNGGYIYFCLVNYSLSVRLSTTF